jgi:hypothetical protein
MGLEASYFPQPWWASTVAAQAPVSRKHKVSIRSIVISSIDGSPEM